MAFGLPEYYQRLGGTIHIGERNQSTGGLASTGLHFVGDASELTFDAGQEFVEHMEHQSGDGKKDVRIPRMISLTGNMILDNTGAQNFKNFMRGVLTTEAGATISAEAHTAPAVGHSFLLDKPIVTAVTSITDVPTEPDPAVPYTVGTDYVVDGRVVYVPVGSSMGGESVLANYTAAASKSASFFGAQFKEFYVYFQGYNTINKKGVALELYKVSFDAASMGNLLGDEIITMSINFEALFEPLLATAGNLAGIGNYILAD
jgi:hypothetical protein